MIGQEVYGTKQAKDMTDAELLNQLQAMQRMITNTSANSERFGYTSGNLYQRLADEAQNEISAREAKKQSDLQTQKLSDLFNQAQGGGGAPSQPGFDYGAYESDLQKAAEGQRQGVNDVYNNQQNLGLQGLSERYAPLRQQAIEEAGVLGNLRSPSFQGTTLANMDAQRSRDTSNLLGQIGQGRGQALTNVNQGLAQQLGQGREFGAQLGQQGNQFGQQLGLNRAQSLGNLLNSNNQFGQTFGLENQKFNAGQRQNALENTWTQQGFDQADRLGNLMANAQKPSGLADFGNVLGGVGNVIGGITGLAGAVKGLGGGLSGGLKGGTKGFGGGGTNFSTPINAYGKRTTGMFGL